MPFSKMYADLFGVSADDEIKIVPPQPFQFPGSTALHLELRLEEPSTNPGPPGGVTLGQVNLVHDEQVVQSVPITTAAFPVVSIDFAAVSDGVYSFHIVNASSDYMSGTIEIFSDP